MAVSSVTVVANSLLFTGGISSMAPEDRTEKPEDVRPNGWDDGESRSAE